MKAKKQNGFVIELMIIFMLVTFSFCMVVTTFMSTLVTKRRLANEEFERQIALNQIGEYYLRAVESGKKFPTLQSGENLNSYDWLNDDATAKNFFNSCKGKYKLETLYAVKRAGFLEFYATKAVSYKLIVKAGNTVQMVVILVETRNGNNEAHYEVKDWSITDIHTGLGDYSESENLSVLKKLWIWLGNTIQSWQDYFNG